MDRLGIRISSGDASGWSAAIAAVVPLPTAGHIEVIGIDAESGLPDGIGE